MILAAMPKLALRGGSDGLVFATILRLGSAQRNR
jgi:hypothetical protein